MAKSYALGEKSVKALAKLFREEANRSKTVPQPRGAMYRPVSEEVIRFELLATLTAGSSASAKRLYWVSGAYTKTGDAFDVYDFIGSFSGVTGDWGYCKFFGDRGVYEVIQLEC